jgi:hypothetical protein
VKEKKPLVVLPQNPIDNQSLLAHPRAHANKNDPIHHLIRIHLLPRFTSTYALAFSLPLI